ncbi:MAG: type II toxin-antitoxin system death-on-curing family toxin [Brevundimonas sp.]|uniref:type II toxin-antitoxin system death-on-curing family toxin n=1 Tax=Brevundimonas sp. TaxID=1871086 RepID=UPI0025BABFE4|nr:type II toxin-antitoxin system death-on-curing family toxin [Brevundimonas sp.]MBX3476004.1 type II toxin-antitoxin system death-on-curing family toxin [Brevundimonas sp.]
MSAAVQWLEIETVLAAHDEALAIDGGMAGLRDRGLLESALERPKNRYHYEGVEDVCELAATYAVGIAKNHPFADGNKRSAFIAMATFLLINARPLVADQTDATTTMLAVAAGEMEEPALAAWIRANSGAD